MEIDQFITGHNFKNRCRYSLDEQGFAKRDVSNNCYWIKTDLLAEFRNNYLPTIAQPFTLLSGNSDYCITQDHAPILSNEHLTTWYGQNVCFEHPKLKSLPIGIANVEWGTLPVLKNVMDANNAKLNMVYANFDINTNPTERARCLHHTGITLPGRKNKLEYLTDVSKSYFCIAPNGNGVDCHRQWECLYLKTIPILTDCLNVRFYRWLPFLIIKDWTWYRHIPFSKEMYDSIWGNFDIARLEGYITDFTK